MAEPSIIEIHHRREVVAVSAASTVVVDDAGRWSWVVGPLVPVEPEPEPMGAHLVELVAGGAPEAVVDTSAAANGDWCRTFGFDELGDLVHGLRTVVLVVGPTGAAVEHIDRDGRPVVERDLDPDDLTDPDRLGLIVLGALERAPQQRRFEADG